jgi:Ser/Thr protein kinase RdoA (MazF antagonist)
MTGTVADLRRHLEDTYGVKVTRMTPLEPWAPDGVQRVDLEQDTSWVARTHGPVRPIAEVHGDADILRYLAHHDFPAERLAHPEPVSSYDSVSVIVTELLPGENCRGDSSPATIHGIGRLLGRLHTLPATEGAVSRPAGGWHHLSQAGGGRDEDVRILRPLLAQAAARLPDREQRACQDLVGELESVDLGTDLPHCLINVDFGGPNTIKSGDELSTVDWTGSGRGPRVQSLGTLAWVGHPSLIDAFVAGYRESTALEPEELDRLDRALVAHGLILQAWGAAFRGVMPSAVLRWLAAERKTIELVVERTRRAFEAPL